MLRTLSLFSRKRKLHSSLTAPCFSKPLYISSVKDLNVDLDIPEVDSDSLTSLDRLLRVKPAIDRDFNENEFDLDGRPDPTEDYEMTNNDPDPSYKIAKKLLSVSRVYYRHIEPYPSWFTQKQQEISSHRTPAQIRRCLKNWMVQLDRDLLQKYKSKNLYWGNKLPEDPKPQTIYAYGPEETVSYSYYYMPSRYSINTRIFKEFSQLMPSFVPRRIIDFGCGPATAGAAAYTVWPDSIKKYTGIDMSQSMIDAAKLMMTDTVADATFWNKSSEIVKRAANLNERFDLAIISYTLSELPNDPSKRAAVQLMFELLDVGGCLLILESGNPMGSHTTRTARQLVLDIFNNVDQSGSFTANPIFPKKNKNDDNNNSNNDIDDDINNNNEIDNNSINNYNNEKKQKKTKPDVSRMVLPSPSKTLGFHELGAFVVAPCTHDKPCPLASGVWCSFSQKVFSGMIRKASEEKYSYVIIQKRPKINKKSVNNNNSSNNNSNSNNSTNNNNNKLDDVFGNWTNNPETNNIDVSNPTPLNVLQRFIGTEEHELPKLLDSLVEEVDWEEYNPPLKRHEWARVLRSPIKGKGHVTFDLCMSDGNITRNVISRSNLVNIPAIFTALRKTTWGGLLPVLADDTEKSPLTKKNKGVRPVQNNDTILINNKNKENVGKKSQQIIQKSINRNNNNNNNNNNSNNSVASFEGNKLEGSDDSNTNNSGRKKRVNKTLEKIKSMRRNITNSNDE